VSDSSPVRFLREIARRQADRFCVANRGGEDTALAEQMRSAEGGRRGLFEVPFRRNLAGCGTTQLALKPYSDLTDSDGARTARRMLKKAVRRGRSERRGEAYASVR